MEGLSVSGRIGIERIIQNGHENEDWFLMPQNEGHFDTLVNTVIDLKFSK
jgi:hypothetical protein